MKLPLRLTVTTAFALFTAVTVSVVAALNFYGNRAVILETAKTSIAQAAESAEQGVDHLVGRAVLTADTVANLPKNIFDWKNPGSLFVTLAVSLRASPEIYSVFVGFPDGAFVQAINLIAPDGSRRKVSDMPASATTAWRVIGPVVGEQGRSEEWRYFDSSGVELLDHSAKLETQVTYDPRARGWFKESQKSDKPSVSKVYVFASLKLPGVTVSQSIKSLPDMSVGVDLSLEDLSALTEKLSPGKGGVVAIINEDGDVIAHPDQAKVLKLNPIGETVDLVKAVEIEDARIQHAAKEAQIDHKTHKPFSVDGAEYISYVLPVAKNSANNWQVISVAAVTDFTGDLVATLTSSLAITATVMVLAILGVAVMAGWITRPILRLRRMSDQITQLNFTEIENFDTPFEEISKLRNSMDHMKSALDTFLRFVPRDVVRGLVQSGQAATVGGANREVTLLFTDVENFTTMTERMTPEEIMSQVSVYLESLSFGIQSNRGTIDKFIGDAIMAIWNAPAQDDAHADNACRGALAAFHMSEELNATFTAKGQSIMRTRFGLHTGDVLVGNVGAKDRMQYTCLGSNVNLAARIEGLNKFYGTQILASDAVRRKASSDFLFRRVDIVEAKGTSVPVVIYELMGDRGKDAAFPVTSEMVRRASKYEQAFDFYLHRDFADALVILGELDLDQPGDPVVSLLSSKCQKFVLEPPPPAWNGATALDEK